MKRQQPTTPLMSSLLEALKLMLETSDLGYRHPAAIQAREKAAEVIAKAEGRI